MNTNEPNSTTTPLDLAACEQMLRALRAEVQRRAGKDYCSVSIEGCGKLRVYVHQAGAHDGTTLVQAIDSAVAASAPRERAAKLRQEAEQKLAEAAKLEGIRA